MEDNVNMSNFSHEIWNEHTERFCVEVKHGAVDAMDTSIEEGAACRVINDGRMGFVYSTNPGTSEEKLIELATEISKHNDFDKDLMFPVREDFADHVSDGGKISSFPVEDKIEIAKELESAAKAFDKRIRGIRKAVYEDSVKNVEMKNANGVSGSFSHAVCAVRVTVIADDGDRSEWETEIEFAFLPGELEPRKIAESAAKRAIEYLDSQKVSSQRLPCLLDRHIVAELLDIFAPMFFADSVFKRKSVLSEKMGEEIYSKRLTIVNDGTLKRGVSSTPFDGEGAATRRTLIVKNGVLRSFLADTYYSHKMGIPSTGSSIRPSINNLPKIGAQNIYIEQGDVTVPELMTKMVNGVYITDALGLHTANPVTGDFSIGAAGFVVRNGKIVHSFKGVTIAGNIGEIFKRVIDVANDLKFWYSKGGATLLIEELAIGA